MNSVMDSMMSCKLGDSLNNGGASMESSTYQVNRQRNRFQKANRMQNAPENASTLY